jgi:hypothetical protein
MPKYMLIMRGTDETNAAMMAELDEIRERAHGELDEDQARCTAAVVATALRLVLERSTKPGSNESPSAGLGQTLRYLRAGAHL